MGRQTGAQRRAAWREKAYSPENWESWSPAYQKKVYGTDKYQENLEAAVDRRNLRTSNFLKSFAGLLSPITTPAGILTNNPSLIGWGYSNPKDASKVHPQPWIVDKNTGDVIENPALGEVDSYLASHSARQKAYDDSTITGLLSDGGINVDDPFVGIAPKMSDKTIDTYEQFIERTKNSPAMRAGVFDPKDLYQDYVKDQDFQVARNAGNLEEFARLYPRSQTAKRLRERVPYGRPDPFPITD